MGHLPQQNQTATSARQWTEKAISSAQKQPGIFRSFFKSPHHAWLALATIGLGFLSANPFFLLVGAATYALCWIYFPDSSLFKRWVALQHAAQLGKTMAEAERDFRLARDRMVATLPKDLKKRFEELDEIYADIRQNLGDTTGSDLGTQTQLHHIRGMLHSCLRLLELEAGLRRFLTMENTEEITAKIEDLQGDIREIESSLEGAPAWDDRRKVLESKRTSLASVQRRMEGSNKCGRQMELAEAELERLSEHLRLIRSELVMHGKPEAIFAHIDASMAIVENTNQWLDQQPGLAEALNPSAQVESVPEFDPGAIHRASQPQ